MVGDLPWLVACHGWWPTMVRKLAKVTASASLEVSARAG